MTRQYRNIGSFIAALEAMPEKVARATTIGLHDAGNVLLREVISELGTYQIENMGPYPEWSELADRTKDDRVRAGFSENDPGVASGAMLNSYGVRAQGNHASVGSDDPHALWFETGTVRGDAASFYQPPRSVLGLAAFRKGHEAADVVGRAVARVLEGRPVPNRVEVVSDPEAE